VMKPRHFQDVVPSAFAALFNLAVGAGLEPASFLS
jgi:hypothetical protein